MAWKNPLVRDVIPNPFDPNGTLADYTKSGMTLSQGVNILSEIWKTPLVLTIVAALISATHLPWWLFVVVIVARIVGILFKVEAFRSLRRLSAQNTGQGVLAPIIINRRNQVNTALLDTPAVIVVILALAKLYAQQAPTSILATQGDAGLLALAALVLVLGFLNWAVGQAEVGGYKRASDLTDIGQAAQRMEVVKNEVQLFRMVPILTVIAGVFAYSAYHFVADPGIVTQGTASGGLVGLVIIGLGTIAAPLIYLVSIRRMATAKLDSDTVNQGQARPAETTTSVEASNVATTSSQAGKEKVVDRFFGILPNYGLVQGFEILGKGEVTHPENSLIVTDRRLLFIEVPSPGGSAILGDIKFRDENFFFNRGQLNDNGEALLSSASLDQILGSKPKNFAVTLDEIRQFKIDSLSFALTTSDNKKYGYVFMDKSNRERLTNALKPLLGERLTA